MANIFSQDSYTEGDIRSLIDNSIEESVYLDFKASQSLDKSDSKKNEIAKDVSAFANSDGGIIIYGINESDHKADSLSFVDGNTFTKEWLEQIINSKIQKRISGITIHPVRFMEDLAQTVYVVKIPASNGAPHMASDKRFYKRFNFQSVQMEEYEIRDLYLRKTKAELEIADIIITQRDSISRASKPEGISYGLGFQVRNVGQSVEERFKLEIKLPRGITNGYGTRESPLLPFKVRDEGDLIVYSIPNSSPLFQGELTTSIVAYVSANFQSLSNFDEPGIYIKLYFSNGTAEREFKILNKLTYDGNPLHKAEWFRG